MRLRFLHANMVWVFTFGDALLCMDGEPLFFDNRADAVLAAERHRLLVDAEGVVSAPEEGEPS